MPDQPPNQYKPGDMRGPYRVDSLIGKGGMGEVYRGTDTRLGRPVALKVSARQFSDRFEREAKAISSLNHPNICTLYDVGPNYLVLEFVEGDTLAHLIKRGPMPLEAVLKYSIQMADALSAAHAKGIVHRDLKPANVIVTGSGVKVLDFGLAKLSPTVKFGATEAGEMETKTEPLTEAGSIMGTLHYMAPEQAEGKDTDERSDIFAFGAVVYEVLTGRRAFDGESRTAILAAVLKDQPAPITQFQPITPRALDRVIRKCLEKNPADRWHSAHDLKQTMELIDIAGPASSSGSGGQAYALPDSQGVPRRYKGNHWLWPAITTALVAAVGVTAWLLWPKPAVPQSATRFQVTLPDNVTFNNSVSISPDGHKLVFNATAEGGFWLHKLDTLEWRRLPGTEGGRSPFWSPDSRFLGFRAGGQLKKIEIAGGPAQTLCAAPNVGTGSWNRDDVIVFGSTITGPMYKVSAGGGTPTELTVLDSSHGEILEGLPSFLPDGKHFLYLHVGPAEVAGIYIGSVDAKPAEQSRERLLATGNVGASFVKGEGDGGYVLFLREGTLMAQPFDAGKLRLRGEPVPVAENVGTSQASGTFSASATGVLVYHGATQPQYQPTWFDRRGNATATAGEPSSDRGYTLSPDATRVAVRDGIETRHGDIWQLDFARAVRTRLTFRHSDGSFPVWSPDGTRIIFAAGLEMDSLFEKASSGGGEEKELLKKPGELKRPVSWSRDGRFLLYYTAGTPKTGFDLWVLPLEGDRKPVLLLGTDFEEREGQFSPDMRWIAYVSNESGRLEVYVRPFSTGSMGTSGSLGPALGDGKWQVSKDGGRFPSWRADGKEIVFRDPNGSPMAVDVNGTVGTAFQAGIPRQLFAAPAGVGDWDVTADGKRFLMGVPPGRQTVDEPITVVLNWQAGLKK